jgi:hypothetical protein
VFILETRKTRTMRWENSLVAYEEDVRNPSFWDWMKAHTSGFKPLHRYEGMLELKEDRITFDGKDVKESRDFNLEIRTEPPRGTLQSQH